MIKKLTSLGLILCAAITVHAQLKDSTYRASATIYNNLKHTKLAVSFDYAKRYLYGKEWVTLHPHFYPTDSLTLDAKGMDIKTVALVKNASTLPLKYTYDGHKLRIKLDKTYKATEDYTIHIDYTSKPDELKDAGGSAAITASKGLYFINPDGTDKYKPTQIWTQGETDANSVWFPTIDKNNQKTTSEIAIKVPSKYVTLSNGRLAAQVDNHDGTRTDTWKMDLPHAPYLFMMAVGDFKIYKDNYMGKEVSYYLEPAYAPYAKQIFGNTPEMIGFYSKILDVPYPWNKYSQIICRDYVSGAMENTTATLHGDYVQRNSRDLLDGDPEDFISHELFHQWFGDLVACESWSNITMNESFADYSEYLWFEHKYGLDRADEHLYNNMTSYYFAQADAGNDAPLVRYYYDSQEDVFDGISYQKGGSILHMLRKYVGDEAFFKSLNLYLKQNAFKSSEPAQLRLAFEEVTGQDLNWFFNQWYFDKGYPVLNLSYKYDDVARKVDVTIKQTQNGRIFKLPMAVDIYSGGVKSRQMIVLDKKEQTFSFSYKQHPDLVDVDGDKMLLAKINDTRNLDELIYGYTHAGLFRDRQDAVLAAANQQKDNPKAQQLLLDALHDKYSGIQLLAINSIKLDSAAYGAKATNVLEELARNDKNPVVRSTAMYQLNTLKNKKYEAMYLKAAASQSYEEAGAALAGLNGIDPDKAYTLAKQNENDAHGGLEISIGSIYIKKADEANLPFFSNQLHYQTTYNYNPTALYCKMLGVIKSPGKIDAGLDEIKQFALDLKNSNSNAVFVRIITKFFITVKKKQADEATDPAVKKELTAEVDHAQQVVDALQHAG